MENQHRKISGYRELNEADIASMNAVKEMGKRLSDLIEQLEPILDPRWRSIATTHLQQGLMALTRAIAKPDFF
jgi:hypothetical protein